MSARSTLVWSWPQGKFLIVRAPGRRALELKLRKAEMRENCSVSAKRSARARRAAK